MDEQKSASATLDQIREGGNHLVLTAFERLSEIRAALEEGRFMDAHSRCQELMGRIGPLASAENHIAIFGELLIVRAAGIEPGMILHQLGTVISVEPFEREHPGLPSCQHIKMVVEGNEDQEFESDQELVIVRGR